MKKFKVSYLTHADIDDAMDGEDVPLTSVIVEASSAEEAKAEIMSRRDENGDLEVSSVKKCHEVI